MGIDFTEIASLLAYPVLILNFTVLALYDAPNHSDSQPQYLTIINLVVDAFFVLELILILISRNGDIRTFNLPKICSMIASLAALTDIALIITTQFVNLSDNQQYNYLEIVRAVRLVKIGILTKHIPSLGGNKSLVNAALELLVHFTVPLIVMTAFALGMYVWIGDSLQYRCIPDGTSLPALISNPYYSTYGIAFFFSPYNNEFCGDLACDAGYKCSQVIDEFTGVLGDYATPWKAFVTNMSFLTMRGWTNIFWAIVFARGSISAAFIALILMGIGGLLIFNTVVAMVVRFMKIGAKYFERRIWLRLYPGELSSVTELELVIWAKRNNQLLLNYEDEVSSNVRSLRRLVETMWKMSTSSKKYETEDSEGATSDAIDPQVDENILSATPGVVSKDKSIISHHEKIRTLSPNCNIFKFIRHAAQDRFSTFNLSIFALIVADLIFFAFASRNTRPGVEKAIEIGNEIICALFGVELLVMIISFGPIHYWNSFFNVYESMLILLALGSLPNGVCPYANIFRIVRIFRDQSRFVTERRYERDSIWTELNHWIMMINEAVESIGMYALLSLSSIYTFAIIGTRIFPTYLTKSLLSGPQGQPSIYTITLPNGQVINLPIFPLESKTVMPLIHLESTWSNRVLGEYNYDYFSVSYVTTFSLSYLNSWYSFMVQMMLRTRQAYFWYFFVWIVLTNFVLMPVLTSRILSVMDKRVSLLSREAVDRNRRIIDRLAFLRQKTQLFKYFQKLKKNSSDLGAGLEETGVNPVADTAFSHKEDEAVAFVPPKMFLQQLVTHRQHYPLYLFSPDGPTASFFQSYLNTPFFSFCLFASVILNIIDVLGENDYPSLTYIIIEGIAFVFFAQETLFRWFANGLFIRSTGYFFSLLNVVDFILNVLLGYILFSQNRSLVPFLIIRVVKVPYTMSWAIRSKSIRHLAEASSYAVTSLILLTIISLLVCFFFAVFGLQLWRRQMYYCATIPYSPFYEYPDGLSRYANVTGFPRGCSGYNVQYDAELSWISAIDTFDNIFVACQSIFRVMMMNNWGSILFLTMSAKGYNINPEFGSSPAAFLFFIFSALFAVILNALFAGVIYYHYLLTSNLRLRGVILNQDTITMRELKDALHYVDPPPPTLRRNAMMHSKFLHKLQTNRWYLLLSLSCTFIPIILVFGAFTVTYKYVSFSYFDAIYSIVYVGEYVLRIAGLGPAQVIGSSLGKAELVVIAVVILQILISFTSFVSDSIVSFAQYLTLIVIVLRTIRIAWAFPQLGKEFRMLFTSLTTFIPLVVAMVCFVIVFAVVGKYWFSSYEYDYGVNEQGTSEEFLANNYHFKTYFHSFFTLWGIATGNNWTTIVDNLLQNRSPQMKVAISVYFVAFYLIMNFSIRSIAIILIVRFLDQSGTHNSFSQQQVADFLYAWSFVTEGHASAKCISRQQLTNLLLILNPPLGIPVEENKSHSVVQRMIHKISLVIYSENIADSDLNPPSLPMQQFEFHDVLIALHRIALFGFSSFSDESFSELVGTLRPQSTLLDSIKLTLPSSSKSESKKLSKMVDSEREFQKKRAKAASLKLLARTYITQHVFSCFRSDAFDLDGSFKRKDAEIGKLMILREKTSAAVERMQQLQHFDPALYRDSFIRLATNYYHVARQYISSYGLIDIDAITIVYVRKAVKLELKAARLQYLTLEARASSLVNEHSVTARLKTLHEYYRTLVKLHADFNSLYREHVSQTWDFNSLRVVQHIETAGKAARTSNAITAVCIDGNNSIYVASAGGVVTEWGCRHPGQLLKENESFSVTDRLGINGEIRAMTASIDGIYLYVGNNNAIFVFKKETPKPGSALKKRKFKEISRLYYHRGVVNCIRFLGTAATHLVSAGNEGSLALWSQTSQIPIRKKEFSDPIFAITSISINDRHQLSSERTLSDVLICGLSSGKLEALALPLSGSMPQATEDWKSMTTNIDIGRGSSHGAVTALAVAWGYLFVGCADGAVLTFGFSFDSFRNVTNVFSSFSDPLDGFQLIFLSSIACHSEAVTSMLSVGHGLISTSHDFGVVAWEAPERIGVTSPGQYRQNPGKGLVLSDKRIICAAGNEYAIVTGDEIGNVFVCSPAKCDDNLATSSTTKGARSKCVFSFLEHDFQECFAPFRGVQMEEEVYLNVRNISANAVTLRTSGTRLDVFTVSLDCSQSIRNGCELVPSSTGYRRDMIVVPPQAIASFRLGFLPPEVDMACEGAIEFLIDEQDIVRIMLKGFGIRSQLRLDDRMLVDLGTLGSDQVVKRFKVFNPTRRDFVMSFCDNTDINKSFQKKGLQVSPATLIVPKQDYARITVSFHPDKFPSLSPEEESALSSEPVEQDLYYFVNGARLKVVTIRSKLQLESLLIKRTPSFRHRQTVMNIGSSPAKPTLTSKSSSFFSIDSDFSNNPKKSSSVFSNNLKRPLRPDESICSIPVAIQQLTTRDWGMKLFDNHTACLMHMPSGIFLELINPMHPSQLKHSALSSKNDATVNAGIQLNRVETDPLGVLQPYCANTSSSVTITVSIEASPEEYDIHGEEANVSYCELWCGNICVAKHIVTDTQTQKRAISISFSAKDLSNSAYGALTMELYYFNTRGQSTRNPLTKLEATKKPSVGYVDGLLRMAYFSVAKGIKFELVDIPGMENKRRWIALEQLDIVGISKIVSFAASGSIICTETFDRSLQDNDPFTDDVASCSFGDALLTVSAYKLPSKSPLGYNTQVCDIVELIGTRQGEEQPAVRPVIVKQHLRHCNTTAGKRNNSPLAQDDKLNELKRKRGHFAKMKPSFIKDVLLENSVAISSATSTYQQPKKIRKFLPEQDAVSSYTNNGRIKIGKTNNNASQTANEVVLFPRPTLPVCVRDSISKKTAPNGFARRIIATFHHDPLSSVSSDFSGASEEDSHASVADSSLSLVKGEETSSEISSVVPDEMSMRRQLKDSEKQLLLEQAKCNHEFSVALDLHVIAEVLVPSSSTASQTPTSSEQKNSSKSNNRRQLALNNGQKNVTKQDKNVSIITQVNQVFTALGGKMSSNYLNSMLPLSLSSPYHSVTIAFTTPTIETTRMHTTTTCMRAGLFNDLPHTLIRGLKEEKNHKNGSFFDGWKFVLRQSMLRLVQTTRATNNFNNNDNNNTNNHHNNHHPPKDSENDEALELLLFKENVIAKLVRPASSTFAATTTVNMSAARNAVLRNKPVGNDKNTERVDATNATSSTGSPVFFTIYAHEAAVHVSHREEVRSARMSHMVTEEDDCVTDQELRQINQLLRMSEFSLPLSTSSATDDISSKTFSSMTSHTATADPLTYTAVHNERVRVSNIYGQTYWKSAPPKFLQELCEIAEDDHVLQAVKSALRKLSELPEFESLVIPSDSKISNSKARPKDSKKMTNTEDFETKFDQVEELNNDAEDGLTAESNDRDSDRNEAMRSTYERVYYILLSLTNLFSDKMKAKMSTTPHSPPAHNSQPTALMQKTAGDKSSNRLGSVLDVMESAGNASVFASKSLFLTQTAAANTHHSESSSAATDGHEHKLAKENPNSILRTRLNRSKLFQFLSYQTLPGLQKPLSTSEVTMVLSTLHADNIGVISPMVFCSWIMAPPLQQQVTKRVLTERTIFARMLEENMDHLLRWRAEMLRMEVSVAGVAADNASSSFTSPLSTSTAVSSSSSPSCSSSSLAYSMALTTMKSSRFVSVMFSSLSNSGISHKGKQGAYLWRQSNALQKQLTKLVSCRMSLNPSPSTSLSSSGDKNAPIGFSTAIPPPPVSVTQPVDTAIVTLPLPPAPTTDEVAMNKVVASSPATGSGHENANKLSPIAQDSDDDSDYVSDVSEHEPNTHVSIDNPSIFNQSEMKSMLAHEESHGVILDSHVSSDASYVPAASSASSVASSLVAEIGAGWLQSWFRGPSQPSIQISAPSSKSDVSANIDGVHAKQPQQPPPVTWQPMPQAIGKGRRNVASTLLDNGEEEKDNNHMIDSDDDDEFDGDNDYHNLLEKKENEEEDYDRVTDDESSGMYMPPIGDEISRDDGDTKSLLSHDTNSIPW